MDKHEMMLEADGDVDGFMPLYRKTTGVSYPVTVCYKGRALKLSDQLAPQGFLETDKGRFLHVRVEDEKANELVQEYLAKHKDDIIIPLSEVKIKEST